MDIRPDNVQGVCITSIEQEEPDNATWQQQGCSWIDDLIFARLQEGEEVGSSVKIYEISDFSAMNIIKGSASSVPLEGQTPQ